jgi:hypothetical protein
MGSARGAGSRLVGFLSDAANRGVVAALRSLNLEALAGQPIETVFLGLVDYICPDGGSIDEGIARDAFIETIADLGQAGITNLDALTPEQLQTVFALYATNAIETKLCNDIGIKAIVLPPDEGQARAVQAQLKDFIRRAVTDALAAANDTVGALTAERTLSFVTDVYEQAFGILQTMGDAEAAK